MPAFIRRSTTLAALALCACVQKRPNLEPITTDRPDKTEGTGLVVPGRTQLEGGVSTYQLRYGGSNQSFGEVLLRYGALPRLEARFDIPSLITSSGAGSEWSGGGLGFKTPLLIPKAGASRAVPALSLLMSTSVATNWSNGPVLGTPEVILASSWSLSDRVELGGNLVTFPFVRYASSLFDGITAVVGVDLTERLGSYAEVYNLDGLTANGGLTYRLTPDFQLDMRVGRVFAGNDATSFAGVGFATRW